MEIERIERDGVIGLVITDDEPMNPRTDWDHPTTMVCWHRRYTLGDEQGTPYVETDCAACGGTGETLGPDNEIAGFAVRPPDCERCEGTGEVETPAVAFYEDRGGVAEWLGLYDHSGISMYVGGGSHAHDGGGWDSGTVGYIYVDAETIAAEWDGDRDKAREFLRGEVETYDQFLTGDVYGYVVEDETGETLDSCFGFFGQKYAREELDGAMKLGAEQVAREATERAEMEARDIITVG